MAPQEPNCEVSTPPTRKVGLVLYLILGVQDSHTVDATLLWKGCPNFQESFALHHGLDEAIIADASLE